MLFHLGALMRLNQAGHMLKLKRISSVSGGSITAGGGPPTPRPDASRQPLPF